jgi:hypothetical protein
MRNGVLLGLLASLTMNASVNAAPPVTLPSEDLIQPSSNELERRVEAWCPGDCVVGVPFVASYRKGNERLVFVGTHHAFQPTYASGQIWVRSNPFYNCHH